MSTAKDQRRDRKRSHRSPSDRGTEQISLSSSEEQTKRSKRKQYYTPQKEARDSKLRHSPDSKKRRKTEKAPKRSRKDEESVFDVQEVSPPRRRSEKQPKRKERSETDYDMREYYIQPKPRPLMVNYLDSDNGKMSQLQENIALDMKLRDLKNQQMRRMSASLGRQRKSPQKSRLECLTESESTDQSFSVDIGRRACTGCRACTFLTTMISIGIFLEIVAVIVLLVLRGEYPGYLSNITFGAFVFFAGILFFADIASFKPAWHYCCLGFSVASVVGFLAAMVIMLVQLKTLERPWERNKVDEQHLNILFWSFISICALRLIIYCYQFRYACKRTMAVRSKF